MEQTTDKERDSPLQAEHRGSNQSGMRAFNERLVLSMVRRHGQPSKSEIARATGLSAQTVSVIMRQLESDRLLVRGEPVRGKVGQPSVPMSLNEDGAYFLGLKIGRRSCELVLTDFLGHIVLHRKQTYVFPMPELVIEFVAAAIEEAKDGLKQRSERIAGLGVAIPFELWNWAEEVGVAASRMDVWRDRDIRADIQAICDWPVYLQNDATAACGAELAFGRYRHLQDFIYLYVGTFIGGGIVLNGSLYSGQSGNAGAIGPMPVPGPDGRDVRLMDQASLVVLERQLVSSGIDPTPLWTSENNWDEFGPESDRWLEEAARGLAHAIRSSVAVVDFEAAVIDGGFPESIRSRLVSRVAQCVAEQDLRGLTMPAILEGSIGSVARALGGASLPLFDRFLIDQNSLMREPR